MANDPIADMTETLPQAGASSLAASDVPSPPGFELREVIGQGGMAVVYRAIDVSLNREVAIKILHSRFAANSTAARRFLDEANITGQLQHPGIPAVYQAGHLADGRPFLAMKLIKGTTLQQLQKQGAALDPLAILEPVSQAVGFAHERRVIHRDLKPHNIMVGSFGEVQVMDWGLAKVVGASPSEASPSALEATGPQTIIQSARKDESNFTQAGTIVGTPAFMAPEQAAGENDKVDARADVFGLGAILCMLLTGKPPYEGDHVESVRLNAVRGRTEAALARLDSCGVAPEVIALCKRCLAFEPGDRPASAQEVADEISRLRRSADERARQAEQDRLAARLQAAEQQKRRWLWIGLAATLSVGIVTALLLAVQSERARQQAEWSRLKEVEAREEASKAKDEARSRLWSALLAEARGLRLSRRPGQRTAALEAIRQAASLPLPAGRSRDELRNEAVAALLLADLEVALELPGLEPGWSLPAFDLERGRYALVAPTGAIHLFDSVSKKELAIIPPPSGNNPASERLAFSPDGRFLAQSIRGGPAGQVRLWRVEHTPQLLGEFPAANTPPAFSFDGRRLACLLTTGELAVVDTADGKRLWKAVVPPVQNGMQARPLWQPSGNILAFFDGGKKLLPLDAVTGEAKAELLLPPVFMDILDWHPAGHILALRVENQRIAFWDCRRGQWIRKPLLANFSGGLIGQFHPAGIYFVTNDWNGPMRVWDTTTGQQVLAEAIHSQILRFDRTGTLLAGDLRAAPERMRVFRFTSGQGLTPILDPETDQVAGSVSGAAALGPDYPVAAFSAGNKVYFVDMNRGVVFSSLPTPGAVVASEGDGRALLISGSPGLLRWPIDRSPSSWVVGPPRRITPMRVDALWAASADGQVVAMPSFDGGAVLLRRADGLTLSLVPQKDVRRCAVDPAGHWVATATHTSQSEECGLKVWDARDGRLLRELPVQSSKQLTLSPDGRWLLTTGGGARLWRTADWQVAAALGGHATQQWSAFAPDSRYLAIDDVPGTIRLWDLQQGREAVRLEIMQHQSPVVPVVFSGCGAHLLVYDFDSTHAHVVHLQKLRGLLAELRLDWDVTPVAEVARTPSPPTVKIVGDFPSPIVGTRHQLPYSMLAAFSRPFDPWARLELAEDLTSRGQAPAALEQINFALALQPVLIRARALRSRVHLTLQDWAAVVADTSYILDKYELEVYQRWYRGQAFQRLNRHEEAIADFTLILKYYPSDSVILERRAASYRHLGKTAQADADLEAFRKLARNRPRELNHAAWQLVKRPATLQDARQALELAQQAVQLDRRSMYLNTLGVAQYRNGLLQEARATLEESLAASKGETDAFDLYFLAMCHHRLGQVDQAKACFAQAEKWVRDNPERIAQNPDWANELQDFQREAQEVMSKPPGK
jgi:WD40 repeat protein/tetratricopeptide (TPR) repeat protein